MAGPEVLGYHASGAASGAAPQTQLRREDTR
jgi:hypothetical protein